MRKIIYSVLHGTAAVFCIFLAAAAVCGCSGMNGAAGNMKCVLPDRNKANARKPRIH